MYDRNLDHLRQYYDREAEHRQERPIADWKIAERDHYLSLLQQEGATTLLEVGAGPGRYAQFFHDNGLSVVCTDLSPEMVRLCRARGLTAYARDFLHLDFPDASFDALFALNCLLHVPGADLPRVLRALGALLKPAGLFYLGQYGGVDREGLEDTSHSTEFGARFYSHHTDEGIRRIVSEAFEVVSFRSIPLDHFPDPAFHFQSLILRPR